MRSFLDLPPELLRRAVVAGGKRVWASVTLIYGSVYLAKNVDHWPDEYSYILYGASAAGVVAGFMALAAIAIFGRSPPLPPSPLG